MQAHGVVLDDPALDHHAGLEQAVALFAVEYVVAHRSVEALDERVLLQAALLDERRLDAMLG